MNSASKFASIYTLFETAISHDLKYPKIHLLATNGTHVVLRMNGGKSKYPGTIAITDDRPYGENSYFGRIERDGSWIPGRDCNPAILVLLNSLSANPAETAAAYGNLTGNCCFCEASLKDARSTAVGYGPICADHFGLAWGETDTAFKVDSLLPFEVPAPVVGSIPSPEMLLSDPATPYWAQSLIREALNRDCVDVANILGVLAASFDARAHQILAPQ